MVIHKTNLAMAYQPLWDEWDGVRELIQNWLDGILRAFNLTSLHEVEIEKKPVQRSGGKTGIKFEAFKSLVGSSASDSSRTQTEREVLGIITFLSIRRTKRAASDEDSDSVGSDSENLVTDSELVITNKRTKLSTDVLIMGETSKRKSNTQFIGGHGEGLKVGILALVRDNHDVTYHTNGQKWTFVNSEDRRKSQKQKQKPQLEVVITQSTAHNCLFDTRVLVEGLHPDSMNNFFDKILFLHPPPSNTLLKTCRNVSRSRGHVCVGDTYLAKLYYKGLFIRDYSDSDSALPHRLHYGYNLFVGLQLGRDRDLPSSSNLADLVIRVWQDLLMEEYEDIQKKSPSFNSSTHATLSPLANRFLDLFETHSRCLDISYAKWSLSAQAVRHLLYAYLSRKWKEHNGAKIWLYDHRDKDAEMQQKTIRSIGRIGVSPPETLVDLFKYHHLLRSSGEKQKEVFMTLHTTEFLGLTNPFAKHVRHLIDVLRDYEPSLNGFDCVWKDAAGKDQVNGPAAKAGPLSKTSLDIDVIVNQKTIYINNRNLSAKYIHSDDNGGSVNCPAFLSSIDAKTQIESVVCDCSVHDLVQQIVDQCLPDTSQSDIKKRRLAVTSSLNLLKLYPRNISFSFPASPQDYPTEVSVTWMTLDGASDFLIEVHPRRYSLSHTIKKPGENQSQNRMDEVNLKSEVSLGPQDDNEKQFEAILDATPVEESTFLTTVDASATLFNLKGGRAYTVQVCARRSYTVAWSQPMLLEYPLHGITNLDAKFHNNELLVSFSPLIGAECYLITVISSNGNEDTFETNDIDWAYFSNDLHRLREVSVLGISLEGVHSYKAASVAIQHQSRPRPKEFQLLQIPALHEESFNARQPPDNPSPSSAQDSSMPISLQVNDIQVGDTSDVDNLNIRDTSVKCKSELEDASDHEDDEDDDYHQPPDNQSPSTVSSAQPIHQVHDIDNNSNTSVDSDSESEDVSDYEDDEDEDGDWVGVIEPQIHLDKSADSDSVASEVHYEALDEVDVHGYGIAAHDLIEVRLRSSRLAHERRFVHFLLYITGVWRSVKSAAKPESASTKNSSIILECRQYLSEADFQNPALGQNPEAFGIYDAKCEFLLVNPELDDGGLEVDITLEEIEAVIKVFDKDHGIKPEDNRISAHEFHCGWGLILSSDSIFREHLYPLLPQPDSDKPKTPANVQVGDFFCGAGGFSEGFRQAGWSVLLGVDSSIHASMSYKVNHPDSDVHPIEVQTLLDELKNIYSPRPSPTVVLISPSCQGFLYANPGGRNNKTDREGMKLCSKIVEQTGAYHALVENVPGLVRPKHLHHLHEVMIAFKNIGRQCRWGILDAKDYGAPTSRKCVFLAASRLGLTLPKFPQPTHGEPGPDSNLLKYVTVRDAIADLDIPNPRSDHNIGNPKFRQPNRPLSEYAKSMGANDLIEHHATSGANVNGWSKSKWDQPACTLRSSCSDRWECVHPDGKRKFTPREMARLMSFPDTYFFSGSVSNQIKQIGNAVCPLVAKAFGETFKDAIFHDYPSLQVERADSVDANGTRASKRSPNGEKRAFPSDSSTEEIPPSKRPRLAPL